MTTGGFFGLKWTCMVCGRERPDAQINVLKKEMFIGPGFEGTVNIRYCNDMPGCLAHAEKVKNMADLRVPRAS